MKILFKEDRFCKCYLSERNELLFEIMVDGMDLRYTLSGHPYEPVLYVKCDNPRFSFNIHGSIWFPSIDASPVSWERFCKDLAIEIDAHVRNVL